MRIICLLVTALLACGCSVVNGGAASATGGCFVSSTWQSANRTKDLGVNDTATDTTGGLSLAQSFLVTGDAGSTKAVTSVSLPLYFNAAVGGNMTLTLRADNAGVPGTIVSNSSVLLQTNLVLTSTSPSLIAFSFDNALNLSVGSTYWIVLEATYPQASTPVIKWAADDISTNSAAYSSGRAKYEGDGTPFTINVFTTGTMGTGRELGFSIDCQ